MEAWIASVIAVAGTLLGSVATHLFQQSHAARSERFMRTERLRQERIEAYSAFAQAVTELRRGNVSLWFHRRREPNKADPALRNSFVEADRLGAAAAHAQVRVELVADDARLVALASDALITVNAVRDATDRSDVARHEAASDDALRIFISAASNQLR